MSVITDFSTALDLHMDEISFDEKELGEARLALEGAEKRFKIAQKQLAEASNRFVRADIGLEKFVQGTLAAKPNPIPKNGGFELANGHNDSWKGHAAAMVTEIETVAAETEGWESMWTFSGLTVQHSPSHSGDFGPSFIRVRAIVPVSPELLLLSQLRCSAQGVLDPSIVAMREHHVFTDDRTALRHCVRAVGPRPMRKRDFVDLTTWTVKDDGTLVFAAKSVPKALPRNVVDRWYEMSSTTRGNYLTFGLEIKPVVLKPSGFAAMFGKGGPPKMGCEVTLVSHVDWRGRVPQSWVDMKTKTAMIDYLKRAEQQCAEWVEQGVAEQLVEKFLPELAAASAAAAAAKRTSTSSKRSSSKRLSKRSSKKA